MGFVVYDIENLYQRYFGSKPLVKVPESRAGSTTPFTVDNTTNGRSSYVSPFKIDTSSNKLDFTDKGSLLYTQDDLGVEIWLPIKLFNLPFTIDGTNQFWLHHATIKITGSSSVIRTSLAERRGSVKELYSIDDYKMSIKGFLIDKKQRKFPEALLESIKELHESGEAFSIDNALVNVFLKDTSIPQFDQQKVVLMNFEIMEPKSNICPFKMELESDCVFTLEVQ